MSMTDTATEAGKRAKTFVEDCSSTPILKIKIKSIGASARNSTFTCGVHSTQ